MSSANKHKVAKSQWRKWSDHARCVFNSVYSQMLGDVGLYLHPKAVEPKQVHWKTTAWNAAWTAADAVDDEKRLIA